VTPVGKTLSDLADSVGGKVIGDGRLEIFRVAPIDQAGEGEITFLAHPRYQTFLKNSRASAVIIGPGSRIDLADWQATSFLEVADPYVAFAKILKLFNPSPEFDRQVSRLAHIASSAKLGEEVTVFPGVYVDHGVSIGRRSVLFPGVFLGRGVAVGEDCILHPNVVVRDHCRLGDRVVLHAGVVIGSDGFGYAGEGDQRIKIPQIGNVLIEDDVEIGANTTVDRATLGRTIIGRGSKIDNLVQIAHNVVIGENSVIAAQAGIAGSTRLGKNVTLAGQVGVVNHITIGDGATIGPQSGIPRSVPPNAVLSGGIAAAPHHDWLKVMTLLPQLPKLWSTVKNLEKKMSELVAGR
jgi:UDP-3-O-[3-hydroxymyristoyl] glucosamine N-acyltransferase